MLPFTKLHGLGNDFVFVNDLDERLQDEELPDLARAVCDRHFGVGADGLVQVLPSAHADFRMRIHNSDGTEAAHCGNAIRCFAKFVCERGLHAEPTLTVETIGRLNRLRAEICGGRVERVRVDMGEPIFVRERIPVAGPGSAEVINEPLQVGGRQLQMTALSMGNPHAVIFVENIEEFPLEQIGPLVERHEAFPDRINAEFVQVLSPTDLRMRVWERGAGPTLACGTGACATLVAAARTGRAERRATVRVDGGDLEIEWTADNHVLMTGPATEAFTGEWPR